jgi:hypothetical protein
VPADLATAEAGDELNRPQQGIQSDADDVRYDWDGGGEEAGVVRGDLCATAQFNNAGGSRNYWNQTKQDQPDGDEPFRSCSFSLICRKNFGVFDLFASRYVHVRIHFAFFFFSLSVLLIKRMTGTIYSVGFGIFLFAIALQ